MLGAIEATKFYVRYREDHPETEVLESVRRGLWNLSVEIVPYYWIDDIDSFEDLGPTVGVAGFIGDVHRGLKKIGRPVPANVDYPEALRGFYGREIWQGVLGDVRRSIKRVFVKPLEHKAFTGFVWENDSTSRRRIVTHDDDTPVWIAEPVNFVAEYRSMILRQEILDCRLYKGDWSKAPDRQKIEMARDQMWPGAPDAYCLDWGVTDDGRTLLVEMNEGYAFGGYGIHPTYHARMISARWFQMCRGVG